MLLSGVRIDAAQSYSSLLEHNLVWMPYPSSYPRPHVASAARKPPTPVRNAPTLAHHTPAPARNDLNLKTAAREVAQEKVPSPVSPSVQRGSAEADKLSLVGLRGGTITRSNSRPTIQIGYGSMFKDDSQTTGTKNGTRFEEPSCLYVKTTFNF
jgi:hypothetical protein